MDVSSSGSGVATASGLCFASLGSDIDGSTRFPSACNGLTVVKPTWGRISCYGICDLAASYDTIGLMTRSAEDCAAILDVIAGFDANDMTSLRAPVADYLGALKGVDGLKGKKKDRCRLGLYRRGRDARSARIDRDGGGRHGRTRRGDRADQLPRSLKAFHASA
jgi:Asp-tRNA(Asn)/Glu-tRNA(Gln) amidotransferase A subunit family amidase